MSAIDNTTATTTDKVVNVVSIGVSEGDIILRVGGLRDVLERAAKLDGFDDVGVWMVDFVTYYASQFTAADRGDEKLANELMQAHLGVAA